MAYVDRTRSLERGQTPNEYFRYLDAVGGSEISESALQQWSETVSETFSRRNVRSVVDEFADNLQRTYGQLASGDILDVAVNLFLESNAERYKKIEAKIEEAGNDVRAILKLINNEIGSEVIVEKDDYVSLSANALAKLFQKFSMDLIKDEFPNNLFLQLTLTQLLQEQLKKTTPIVQSYLDDKRLQLIDLKKLVAATSVTRSKRSIDITGLLIEAVRTSLRVVLSPIQKNINTVLDTVAEFALALYVSDEPTNPIMKFVTNFTNTLVLRAAEVVLTVQGYVDVIFNNILYGNGTSTTARKRRDVNFSDDSDTKLFDFDEYGKELHLRKARSITVVSSVITIIRYWISFLTSGLNTFVKEVFTNIISNYYVVIGKLVTFPIRYIFQQIINFILPCGSNCTSIL